MSDEAPKSLDTARPPEGDEDVYSASTKVGEASPEILELVRTAQAESAALKPARVPNDPGMTREAPRAGASAAEAADTVATTAATKPPPSDATMAAAHDASSDVAARGDVVGSNAPPAPVRTEQGVPPLSMLVLAVAAVVAVWLGYQALHAPAPPPAPATNVIGH